MFAVWIKTETWDMLTEPSKTFRLSELYWKQNDKWWTLQTVLEGKCTNYLPCILEGSNLQIKLWENLHLSGYCEWRLCVCWMFLVMLSLMSGNNVAIAPTVKAGGPRSASVNMANLLRPTCVCVCVCLCIRFPIHRPVLKRIQAPDSHEGSLFM